jgi:hypothetical protein
MNEECDIFVSHSVAPLSYEIIRVDFNSGNSIATVGSGFTEVQPTIPGTTITHPPNNPINVNPGQQ